MSNFVTLKVHVDTTSCWPIVIGLGSHTMWSMAQGPQYLASKEKMLNLRTTHTNTIDILIIDVPSSPFKISTPPRIDISRVCEMITLNNSQEVLGHI